MAAGDKWIDCTSAKHNLGIQSLLSLLLVDDGSGNPALKTYDNEDATLQSNRVVSNPVAITDAIAHDLFPAVSGKSTYITDLLITNSHATVGTIVTIRSADGTGTVLWQGYVGPTGGGFAMSGMRVPIKSLPNTKLVVIAATTGANVIVSANGYTK